MVGIGTVLLLLALWYGLAWLRRRDLPRSRWFYRCAAVAGIASVIAVESGWITAEVGRQPWIVWEHMKVAEAVTNISAGPIWASFAVLVVVYALIAWAFVGLLLRMRLRWRRADAGLSPERGAGPTAEGAGPDRRAGTGASPGRRGRAVTSADVVALVLVLADRRVRLRRRGRLRRRLLGPDRRRRRPRCPARGRWSTTRWRRSGRPTTSG